MRATCLAIVSIVVAGSAAASDSGAMLDAQQLSLLNSTYPASEIIFDCQGNFSGASSNEHVLGIRQAGQAPIRVGLVLDGGKWTFHDIERELSTDKLPPHYWPQRWEASNGGDWGAPKCNVEARHDPDLSDNGKLLDRPLFALRRGQANACFNTSQQYNNWDCVAYRKGQFRLWYQQVFAD
jgi:hypothetical protein